MFLQDSLLIIPSLYQGHLRKKSPCWLSCMPKSLLPTCLMVSKQVVAVTLTCHATQSHNKGKEADKWTFRARRLATRGCVLLRCRQVHFSPSLIKIEGKSRRVHAQIPEAVHLFFLIRARVTEFIFFFFFSFFWKSLGFFVLPTLCLERGWSSLRQQNSALTHHYRLSGPLGDFEDDAWGHDAKGNEGTRGLQCGLIDRQYEPFTTFSLLFAWCPWTLVEITPRNRRELPLNIYPAAHLNEWTHPVKIEI